MFGEEYTLVACADYILSNLPELVCPIYLQLAPFVILLIHTMQIITLLL